MKKIPLLFLLITINVLIVNPLLAMDDAKSLPLLPAGNHIGMIQGYDPSNPSETERNKELRWEEAISKGMRVANIQFRWDQLEPQPNQYNKFLLESTLLRIQANGLKPYVVIPTIDTDRLSIPSDLVDYNTRTWLKNGMKVDDPRVINRFKKLLDWVVPMVVAHGGWALSVANEPNTYIVDRNEADREFLKPSLINFLTTARSHSHSINPDLGITMSLSQNLVESGETFHINLLEECDLAIFTYYAIDPNYFFVGGSTEVNQELDELLDAAGDKFLVLQELGAASGFANSSSPMNSSSEKQKQFFNTVFSKMEAEPRFRVATVFQLVDWSENLAEATHVSFLRNEGIVSSDYLERFSESLETTGLLHYLDGSPKAAWYTVINWIQRFNNPQPTIQPEPVDLQPEPVDVQPEPVDVQPEPVDAQPEPVDVQPEPVDVQPVDVQPVDVQPEPVDVQPEPVDVQPEPVDVQPEPVDVQPEPVDVQPEPVDVQPEPVDVQPEPVDAEPETSDIQPENTDIHRNRNHRRRVENRRRWRHDRRNQEPHRYQQRIIRYQLLD